MRLIQIQPVSLAVGAVILGAAFLFAANGSTPNTPWPPPKSMILNVLEEPAVAFPVPAGGTYTLLTVPTDRWLTITGAAAGANNNLRWAELSAGAVLTSKGRVSMLLGATPGSWGSPEGSPVGCAGPIGWTFAPGSQVVLQNPTPAAQGVGWYSLIGYYSRN